MKYSEKFAPGQSHEGILVLRVFSDYDGSAHLEARLECPCDDVSFLSSEELKEFGMHWREWLEWGEDAKYLISAYLLDHDDPLMEAEF